MQSFWTALFDHPILLVIMLMFFMGFVGMTYDFILRLCGKKTFLERPGDDDDEDSTEPPEPANVPKTPNDPDDVLEGATKLEDNDEIEGAEEIADEDGNTTIEYIYSPNGYSQRLDGVQGLDWIHRHSDMKKKSKEKVH